MGRDGTIHFRTEDLVKKRATLLGKNSRGLTRLLAALMCVMLVLTGCSNAAAKTAVSQDAALTDESSLVQQAAEARDGSESEFMTFLWDEFLESMESDYLSMHFYVEDYQALGIEKPELTLGSVDPAGFADAITENQAVLDSEAELVTKMADEYGCTIIEPDESIREATIEAIRPMDEDWDLIQGYAE